MLRKIHTFIVALLTPCMVLLHYPVAAAQAVAASTAGETATEILHKPLVNVEAGNRVTVYAEVKDSKGIDAVRVYFKARRAADYCFMPMNLVKKNGSFRSDINSQGYAAVLPAPAKNAQSFDYLIVVKNDANLVVTSQTYSVAVAGGGVKEKGSPVQVFTELAEAPAELVGFADDITIEVIGSTGKLGAVAGLYKGLAAGGEDLVAGGAVVASRGDGISTTTLVVGAAAIALVGGVVALAAGGGGSGGGDNSQTIDANTTGQDLVGRYTVLDSARPNRSSIITINGDGTLQTSAYIDGVLKSTITGNWSYTQDTQNLSLSYPDGSGTRGTISGSTTNFFLNGTNADGSSANYHFQR